MRPISAIVTKFSYPARHRVGSLLLRGLLLALVGAIVGALIGRYVTASRLDSAAPATRPYSQMSANPAAAETPTATGISCPDCPDSYGVAARLRAERGNRTANRFRALGTIDIDAAPAELQDDYRYGGRFPDPPSPIDDTPLHGRIDDARDDDGAQPDLDAPTADETRGR
jgi:hypothetical protein